MLCYSTYLLRYTAYIYVYNIAPEDGLESPKHVEHPKIKTIHKNLCILLVRFHIAVWCTVHTALKTYNHRLSRARRIVDCTFGILANKCRILHRPIGVKPDFCDNIIKAWCVLHSYVKKNDGIQFDDTLYEFPLESVQPVGTSGSIRGIAVRQYFAKVFHFATRVSSLAEW